METKENAMCTCTEGDRQTDTCPANKNQETMGLSLRINHHPKPKPKQLNYFILLTHDIFKEKDLL